MRSYLIEKGYNSALDNEQDATIIAKVLSAIRLGVEDRLLL